MTSDKNAKYTNPNPEENDKSRNAESSLRARLLGSRAYFLITVQWRVRFSIEYKPRRIQQRWKCILHWRIVEGRTSQAPKFPFMRRFFNAHYFLWKLKEVPFSMKYKHGRIQQVRQCIYAGLIVERRMIRRH